MKTMIIYDETGRIFFICSGDIWKPVGIPFLEVEVPQGKRIVGVDVSGEEPVVIYEDIPTPHTEQLQEQIDDLANTIVTISMV